jgi:hypothetical protein
MYSNTTGYATSKPTTSKFKEPLEFYFFAISKDKVIMIPKKAYENTFIATVEMKAHKISSDKGLIGQWEFKDGLGKVEFTNQEKCDLDSSGKCYKAMKTPGSSAELWYYDDNFIYVYFGELSSDLKEWSNKLFGIMMYEVNGDELIFSVAPVFNRK